MWLIVLAAVLTACTTTTPPTTDATPTANPTEVPTENVISTSAPPQPTDAPRAFVLKVPTEWAQAAAEALGEANRNEDQPAWQLDVGQPAIGDIDASWVDAILVEGTRGLIVAERPIALAVPFTAQWAGLTLEQAEEILEEGSDFVQALDWSDIQPGLKSLRVNGRHPSDPEYPLQRSWSVIASPEAQPALAAILPGLKASIENDPHAKLAAVGDLMLARTVGEVLQTGNLDYPFEHTVGLLQDADLTIGNLESALGTGGVAVDKGYTFRAPPQAAPALASAGFDLLSLANNHAMDYGPTLLLEAIAALETEGIATTGAGIDENAAHQPFLIELDGLKTAFLSFVDVPQEFRGFNTRSWQAGRNHPGLAWADPARMQLAIEAAHHQADLVVVLLHSGYEYVPQPSPPQVTSARTAIAAGADLVIGHHAHILQPAEFHPGGVIVYGLGNFVFEDAGPPASALLYVWLDTDGVRELQFVPVRLDAAGRPIPASGDEAQAILNNIHSLTDTWRSQTPVESP